MGTRMTGKQYLRSIGVDPSRVPVPELMELGRKAAQLADTRKLVGIKVREEGFTVHTWPADVWSRARSGEAAPARPASHRQIAYLTILHGQAGRHWDFLSTLDGTLDEDEAGKLIDQLRAQTA